MTSAAGFMPISELSPFSKNWVIKGRVTDKDRTPREFTRPQGAKGRVQSIELIDEKGSDIKATFWNEACDKFSFVKKGEVYTFKGGSVKMKQKKYNTTSHSYELSFDNNPLIQIAEVDGTGFENINEFASMKFTKLDAVANLPMPATVDLLVMVKTQMEPRDVRPRKNADAGEDKVIWARTLEVVDETNNMIETTVWNDERCDESLVGRCIAIQKAYIKSYNSRSATTPADKITVDPPIAEAEALKQWWENGGNTGKVTALSDKSGVAEGTAVDAKEGTVAELRSCQENLVGDKKFDFTTVAYLGGCRTTDKEGAMRPITYDSCEKCQRKLSGNYCQKCEKATDAPVVRYILGGLVFEDHTGLVWSSSVGNDSGIKLLHAEPEEMKRLQYDDQEAFSTKIQDALWEDLLQVKIRVKMEEYQGQLRPKSQVLQATPAKYVDCGKKALADLAKLYQHCNPAAQAAVKDLVSAWKNNPTPDVKGKAVFSTAWHDDMSRLLIATC
jgi:replication factor A1